MGALTGEFPKVSRIFLTAEIHEAMTGAWKPRTWQVGSFTVKGFAEEVVPVYGRKWQELIQHKFVD